MRDVAQTRFVRRGALFGMAAFCAVVIAACGGSGDVGGAVGVACRDGASPASVLRAFIAAAGRGDARAEWRLLSPASQRQLGPFSRFRSRTAVELSEGAGTYARSPDLRVVLNRVLGCGSAVAAVAGTRAVEGTREWSAYAVALRRVSARWAIELGAPLGLTPLSSQTLVPPGSVRVGVRISADEPVGTVLLWLDGSRLAAASPPLPARGATVSGVVLLAGPSRHAAVAFARTATRSAAVAWTFSVRG